MKQHHSQLETSKHVNKYKSESSNMCTTWITNYLLIFYCCKI